MWVNIYIKYSGNNRTNNKSETYFPNKKDNSKFEEQNQIEKQILKVQGRNQFKSK